MTFVEDDALKDKPSYRKLAYKGRYKKKKKKPSLKVQDTPGKIGDI